MDSVCSLACMDGGLPEGFGRAPTEGDWYVCICAMHQWGDPADRKRRNESVYEYEDGSPLFLVAVGLFPLVCCVFPQEGRAN